MEIHYKMNVFRANVDSSETVEFLRNQILQSGKTCNEDITVELIGYVHNGQGFMLKIQNMEEVNDILLAEWKQVILDKGLLCEFSYDFKKDGCKLNASARRLENYLKVSTFNY